MNDTSPDLASLFDHPQKSLTQKAYDLLLESFMKRQIPSGSVLQERKLADMLRISRTPVREALNRLESEGFVTRKAGRVLVVTELSTRELIETLRSLKQRHTLVNAHLFPRAGRRRNRGRSGRTER